MHCVVGFEITGSDFKDILFGGKGSPSGTDIADRSFLQLEDISAKFEASTRVSGSLNLAGAATIGVDDGSISLALGIGMEESSERIYFRNITSTLLVLRQNATWRKVGVMDASLPVSFGVDLPSSGFQEVLDNLSNLKPIISIIDNDLFGPDSPQISIDFDIL